MTDHRLHSNRVPREQAPQRRSWLWVKRGFSLLVVLMVGAAVYAGVHRAEQADARAAHQDCLNRAYQSSLDQRAQATDKLIDAILGLNDHLLVDVGNNAAESRDRRAFAIDVARVKSSREQAQQQTAQSQAVDCG